MSEPVSAVAADLLASEARNLHAIQKNAKAMMLRVIDRLDHYPEAKARLEAHLTDKDDEMRLLEQVLDRAGEKTSDAKDATMGAMGQMTGLLTSALEDDVVKTSMATFGLASYEVAAYEGMIVLARKAGREDAVPQIEQCLSKEKAMAEWLHSHMAPTLEKYLDLRSKMGKSAAH